MFHRQRISFIFQNYNLISILNVYENIVMLIQLESNLRKFYFNVTDEMIKDACFKNLERQSIVERLRGGLNRYFSCS